jgi:dolichyl-phosphate-mannose-protein mannosyltransferase
VFALVAVGVIAGGLRFWHLSSPNALVFDEVYYPKAACILVGWSNKTCLIQSSDERYWRNDKWDVGSWVHPPLGKWEIAMGVKAFGMNSFGWRFTTALEGTAVVVLTAAIAQLLFGSALWTFVAGLLLAFEGLSITMSRVALLDTHLEFWIVVGFLFLLLDRRWIDRRSPVVAAVPVQVDDPVEVAATSTKDPPPDMVHANISEAEAFDAPPEPAPAPRVVSPIWRPWRYAAGIALGAAASVKWSGAMAIVGAVLLTYIWETTRRVRGDVGRPKAFLRAFARESFGVAIAFVLIPIAVYMTVWIPWFHHFGWDIKRWWETDQLAAWRYQRSLKATAYDAKTKTYTPTHPYYSRPWSWLFMTRPVNMYAEYPKGHVEQILGIGNPAIFWASFWALPFAAFAWRRMRDWRAGFVLVTTLCLYIPWFFVSRPQFFFYVLPVTPFLVLTITYSLRWLSDATWIVHDPMTGEAIESTRHPYRPVVWGFVLLAVALCIWFYPILTGQRMTDSAHALRLWFQRWG